MGVCNGRAWIDDCGVCSGGTSSRREPRGCHADHTANSDQDCAGICFGERRVGCDVRMQAETAELDFQLGVSEGRRTVRKSVWVYNRGEHGAILTEVLPTVLNTGLAPFLSVFAVRNGEMGAFRNMVVKGKSGVEMVVEAEIESLVTGEKPFSGGRRGETLRVGEEKGLEVDSVHSADAELVGNADDSRAFDVQHHAVRAGHGVLEVSRASALLYLHFPARCESTKRLMDRILRATQLADEAALYLDFLDFFFFFFFVIVVVVVVIVVVVSDHYRIVFRHYWFFVHLWKPRRCLQRFLFGSGAGDLSQTVYLGLVDFAFSNDPNLCLYANRYGGDCLAGCLSYSQAEGLLSRHVTFLIVCFSYTKRFFFFETSIETPNTKKVFHNLHFSFLIWSLMIWENTAPFVDKEIFFL